uniref:Uncharacterized protein n=1 Tax=Arundo donax TaxID=35708 RepID=A0A0A9DT26_ARUDO
MISAVHACGTNPQKLELSACTPCEFAHRSPFVSTPRLEHLIWCPVLLGN